MHSSLNSIMVLSHHLEIWYDWQTATIYLHAFHHEGCPIVIKLDDLSLFCMGLHTLCHSTSKFATVGLLIKASSYCRVDNCVLWTPSVLSHKKLVPSAPHKGLNCGRIPFWVSGTLPHQVSKVGAMSMCNDNAGDYEGLAS